MSGGAPTLTESQCRGLRSVFERGAEAATITLSRWLGTPVRLELGPVEHAGLEAAADSLGPPESLIAACSMGLAPPLGGSLILAFDDRAGLALVDRLLRQPIGTATAWGDLERSAALETTNIVGCALLNALAEILQIRPGATDAAPLVPTPPAFLHEFAGSLLQFALMDQAILVERVLLVRIDFHTDSSPGSEADPGWSLLFVPDAEALAILGRWLDTAAAAT